MTRPAATAIVVAAAAGSLGLFASLSECTPRGGGSTAPVSLDAREEPEAADAPPRGPTCDAAVPRWPGWSPVTPLGSCCPAAMAADPAKRMPRYAWAPCKNGAAGCQEFAVTWSGSYGAGAKVSHDGAGNPKWLMFMHVIDGRAQT